MSSLPFLAPIFLRKAREMTGKYSSGSGSGGNGRYGAPGGKLGGKSGDGYKLGSLSGSDHRKGTFASAKGNNTHYETGSEENILAQSPDGAIMKSVTYSVHVAEDRRGA